MSLRKTTSNTQYDSPGLFTAEMLGEVVIPACAPGVSEVEVNDNEPIQFMSFGSGSSGNCAYIGDKSGGFLLDAGVDPAEVEKVLKDKGISMNHVRGIILTHDHGDHVRYVYTFLRNFRHLLVYCTPKMMNGLLRRHSISRRIRDYHRAIYKEFEFAIGDFTITPFEVSHDGTDNCGFYICHGLTALGVATDIGSITERVEHYMSRVDFMIIESNYDLKMLLEGTYHDHLKARIVADNGHLDNKVSAEFVARMWSPRLKYVFLCHLSHDNNRPEIALGEHRNAMKTAHPQVSVGDGLQEHLSDLQLVVLPRYDATPLYALRAAPAVSR